jgi:hypothetical protein
MSRLSSFIAVAAVAALVSGASAADYRSPLFPTSVAPAAVSYQAPVLTYPAYHPTFRSPTLPLLAPAFVGFDHHAEHAPMAKESIKLYHNVKVRDPHHIACCAETKIIKVPDPCWKPSKCGCCAPQKRPCVYIAICVPKETKCHHHAAPAPCCTPKPSCGVPALHLGWYKPRPKTCDTCHACGCEHRKLRIKCLSDGKYQKYDYGKYRVEVRVKNGYIEVDYDD